ncbi:hypothetical protein D9M70_548730 [compost metagenome]
MEFHSVGALNTQPADAVVADQRPRRWRARRGGVAIDNAPDDLIPGWLIWIAAIVRVRAIVEGVLDRVGKSHGLLDAFGCRLLANLLFGLAAFLRRHFYLLRWINPIGIDQPPPSP